MDVAFQPTHFYISELIVGIKFFRWGGNLIRYECLRSLFLKVFIEMSISENRYSSISFFHRKGSIKWNVFACINLYIVPILIHSLRVLHIFLKCSIFSRRSLKNFLEMFFLFYFEFTIFTNKKIIIRKLQFLFYLLQYMLKFFIN